MTVEDTSEPGPDGAAVDPRIEEGVEHLQRAAREMIAAGRALLDVFEEMVERPEAVRDIVGVVGSIGDLAGRAARRPTGTHGRGPSRATDGEDDDDPPVQRIPVS